MWQHLGTSDTWTTSGAPCSPWVLLHGGDGGTILWDVTARYSGRSYQICQSAVSFFFLFFSFLVFIFHSCDLISSLTKSQCSPTPGAGVNLLFHVSVFPKLWFGRTDFISIYINFFTPVVKCISIRCVLNCINLISLKTLIFDIFQAKASYYVGFNRPMRVGREALKF